MSALRRRAPTAARRRARRPRLWATAAAVATTAFANTASADPGTWFVGVDGGFATADFPTGSVGGVGAGAHLGVGVSDAFNLRVHLDVAHFEGIAVPAVDETGEEIFLPRAGQLWNAAAGVEYVIDTLRWIPTLGLMVGVVDALVEDQPHNPHLNIEVPVGLGYSIFPELRVGAEFRYRMMLLGDGTGPSTGIFTALRVQYAFGKLRR